MILSNNLKLLLILILIISLVWFIDYNNKRNRKKLYKYVQKFKQKENRMFPFRYFTDIKGNVLPYVAVTGFFREKKAEERYYEYKKRGIHLFGITAYKYFPNRNMLENSEGSYERTDGFEYTKEIKNWLCCFRDCKKFGFTKYNYTVDMSESDFYNMEENTDVEKKYDFIYICNKDSDSCPLTGWNAVNRNFDLALKCFPVMFNEFNLKGLVVGRENCGLEEKYKDNITVIGWQAWGELQQKMKEAKFLFVPNIYDASPRVVAECITKDLAVLMNENIVCGYKYINYDTGEFFTDEENIKPALTKLLERLGKISPKKWWEKNYSQEKSYRKLRNFLHTAFQDDNLNNINKVKFIL